MNVNPALQHDTDINVILCVHHVLDRKEHNFARCSLMMYDALPICPADALPLSRHPVDRWYSQYRFEHVEHRDGTKQGSDSLPFQE